VSELEREEQLVLERARRELSPSSEDARRVLEATLYALSVPPLPALQPASGPAQLLPRVGGSAAAKLLVVAAIAALSGVYGYRRGFEAGQSAAPAAPAPASGARSPALAGGALPLAPQAVPRPLSLAPPLAAHAPTSNASPAQAGGARGKRGAGESATPRALTLTEELAILKRVERALREGETGTALELLDELEQLEPSTALAEERLAANVMARCGLGLGSRARLADEFAHAHPASVYLERVRSACSEK
jgi:hypothetical protein